MVVGFGSTDVQDVTSTDVVSVIGCCWVVTVDVGLYVVIGVVVDEEAEDEVVDGEEPQTTLSGQSQKRPAELNLNPEGHDC